MAQFLGFSANCLGDMPVDLSYSGLVLLRDLVIDDGVDQMDASGAVVLVQRDIARAVVVEIADSVNADIRPSLRDWWCDEALIGVVDDRQRLKGSTTVARVRRITMHQDIARAGNVDL